MNLQKSPQTLECFLKNRLDAGCFPESLRALEFAKEKHAEQFRKPEELGIPYITHPMTMACHALAMGINNDVLIAAILLHDVSEDCGVLPENLPVCAETQQIVRLVTKPKTVFSEKEYYTAIAKNPAIILHKKLFPITFILKNSVAYSPSKSYPSSLSRFLLSFDILGQP